MFSRDQRLRGGLVLTLLALAPPGCGGGGGDATAPTPLRAAAIEAGNVHSLAIAPDGSVLAWGSNSSGTLGDGTFTTRVNPVVVSGLGAGANVVDVAGGSTFTLAVKADGTVLAWGSNGNGQLGDGTTTTRLTPVPVSGLGAGSGVIAVEGGGSHALALRSDGSVVAWGQNSAGQVGDASNTQRLTPVPVAGLGPGSGVIAIAASGQVSMALKADGSVLAWGTNAFGQLGDGTNTSRNMPTPVSGLGAGSGVIAIETGAASYALRSDGSVLAWGQNGTGQVGDGSQTNRSVPVPVVGLGAGSGAVAIAAGGSGSHALALRSDGTALGWGSNAAGQLGDGTTVTRLTPVPVTRLADIVAIQVGGSHSLARTRDGTIYAWGSNATGQLGDGTIQASPRVVEPVGGATLDAVTVTAGQNHVLAVRADGSVVAWGGNGSGQLGNGTTDNAFAPVPVPALGAGSGVVALAAGAGGAGGHSLALKADGTVLAWGINSNGQLGDGTTTQRTAPVPVSGLGTGSGVTRIAAGMTFSLALKGDGTVLSWGVNNNNQLGDGTTTQRNAPVQVSGLGPGSGVVAISAGNHGLALKADGTLLAWGGNLFGALGDGTLTNRSMPITVTGVSNIVAIEASFNHSVALRADGVVFTWGANGFGQLGNDTTTSRSMPGAVTLTGASTPTAIATDHGIGGSSYVLCADGSVYGFGSNATGQLATGGFDTRLSPVRLLAPAAASLSVGQGFLVIRRPGGAVATLGADALGQLGDGPNPTTNLTPAPVLVVP